MPCRDGTTRQFALKNELIRLKQGEKKKYRRKFAAESCGFGIPSGWTLSGAPALLSPPPPGRVYDGLLTEAVWPHPAWPPPRDGHVERFREKNRVRPKQLIPPPPPGRKAQLGGKGTDGASTAVISPYMGAEMLFVHLQKAPLEQICPLGEKRVNPPAHTHKDPPGKEFIKC